MLGKVWFVGNSQLITSLISAFCSRDIFNKCSEDWRNMQVSRGDFSYQNAIFNYRSCNMGLTGNPSFINGVLKYSDEMLAFVKEVSTDARVIFILLRGNEFAIESLVDRTVRWDFSYQNQLAESGRQFIRLQDVREHLESSTNSLLASCLLYRDIFPNATIYHVAAPPAVKSDSFILKKSGAFKSLLAEFGVRPFLQRKKIHDLMYSHLAQQLIPHNIKVIFAPPETLSESGGLRLEFSADSLHGNSAYGEALMSLFDRSNLYASV